MSEELKARNAEIAKQFMMCGRIKKNGGILSVKTKEGAWSGDLVANVMADARPEVLSSFGKKSTFPLGEEAAKWQEKKGNDELATEIREITAVLDSIIDETLEEEFGMLAELQEEFFANWDAIKAEKAEVSGSAAKSALEKIRAKRAAKAEAESKSK